VWKEKEVGRERRKHISKAVRILRNGRKINNPNKEHVDKYRMCHSLPNPALNILQRNLNRSTFIV
jgi:hypothetical protein